MDWNIQTPDLAKGLARGMTADLIGGPVDLATAILNLGIAGTGYVGNKLGIISNDRLPALIQRPIGGSDWFAGENTPLTDNGSLGFTVGRLATIAAPGVGKQLSKIPAPSLSEVGAFNFPGWHGTTAGLFPQFKPHYRRGEQLGFGIHTADSEEFARLYAQNPEIARKGKAPALYQTNVVAENPLDLAQIVNENDPKFELARLLAGKKFYPVKDANGVPSVYLQNAADARDPAIIEKILREQGIDALRYISRVGQRPLAGLGNITAKDRATLAFDPEQVQILDSRLLK